MLYIWRSEALKNYSAGWLCAAASSLEEARYLILGNAEAYIKSQWPSLGKKDIAKFLSDVKRDIAVEPEITSTIFINGSD